MEIARSDLRSGIPDRAKLLRDDTKLSRELEKQITLSDKAYGAPLLSKKRILHISPETQLRDWMLRHTNELGFTYQTTDIAGSDVDLNQDLPSMSLPPDDNCDVVICHRVLEHILDDQSAFMELYRILSPGGFLQISVPQSMHQKSTREWMVPDATHHGHVRHYGRDFVARLEKVGFEVKEDHWLLERSDSELTANRAYPMRMYNAYKR